jgi:glycerol kinase
MMNTGDDIVQSSNGLLTSVAYQLGRHVRPKYCLEGSIAYSGSTIQWLRDNLSMISNAAESETLALSVADNGGVYFVPAFAGLFAPYW